MIRARQQFKPSKDGDRDISAIAQALLDLFRPHLQAVEALTLALEGWDDVYPPQSSKKKFRPLPAVENATHGRTMSPKVARH